MMALKCLHKQNFRNLVCGYFDFKETLILNLKKYMTILYLIVPGMLLLMKMDLKLSFKYFIEMGNFRAMYFEIYAVFVVN